MGACGAGRANRAARAAGASGVSGRSPPIEESKANRAVRVSISTVRWKFSSAVREIQATDITRAHRGVPGGMNLTAVVSDDAVVLAVVEHDVGIGDAGHRTVQVVDRQGPVAHATPVVVIESGIDFRKIHRLGIDEFRTADGASGTDPRAREQQKGKRSRFSPIVVLEIHECRVHHIIAVIIVFVAADREIRNSALRAGCGHRRLPRASWDCRYCRSRPRPANQPAVH